MAKVPVKQGVFPPDVSGFGPDFSIPNANQDAAPTTGDGIANELRKYKGNQVI